MPPNEVPQSLNQKELVELKMQIDELFKGGNIRLSKSWFGARILFVGKTYGKLRMCINYNGLHKVTVKNNYLLPRVDDLLDRLVCSKYFNRINLKSEYY